MMFFRWTDWLWSASHCKRFVASLKSSAAQVHQDESESVTRDNHHSPPLSDEYKLKHTRTGWQSHPASVPRQLDKNHMKTLRSSGHDISDYSLTSEISTVSRASKKCHSDKSIIIKINLIVNQFNLEKRKLSAKTNYSKQFVSFQITSVQVTARKLVKHTFLQLFKTHNPSSGSSWETASFHPQSSSFETNMK